MNQINKQKYVNKIRNVKCDICNKDITGYDLSNGDISDEMVMSKAVYHIRKHYREELLADINRFMIVEENSGPDAKLEQGSKSPKNNKKVKQQTAKKEEWARCKLCGENSIAFTFVESMDDHIEKYHRVSTTDVPTQWFFEGVSA